MTGEIESEIISLKLKSPSRKGSRTKNTYCIRGQQVNKLKQSKGNWKVTIIRPESKWSNQD